MFHCVVAVRDSAMNAFARPFTVPSIGVAVRSFSDEVNREATDNTMFAHCDDYELWELAAWDDETGAFVTIEGGRRMVARGKDVKREARNG